MEMQREIAVEVSEQIRHSHRQGGRSQQAELPLGLQQEWAKLPSTKVRRPTPGTTFDWAYDYTAFPQSFADGALELLQAGPDTIVLDPFIGSGTTFVAAAMRGCKVVGVDVSPFSSLLARSRLATEATLKRVRAILNRYDSDSAVLAESISGVFVPKDASYATAVVEGIRTEPAVGASKTLWSEMLVADGRYDSEVVALLSVCLSARVCALVAKGSNPVWLRKIPSARPQGAASLKEISIFVAERILRDLGTFPRIARADRQIWNADVTSWPLPSCFDICLTSPPYLNRLDYAVAHLPELAVLELIAPISIEDLRRSMIGTTKIVSKELQKVPANWGPLCAETLEAILNHESYASRRYYFHTYADYFEKLFKALQNVVHALRPEGRGLIVLQDSFYKNLHIPTPEICLQMISALSCRAEIVRSVRARSHMGQMSPRQQIHAPGKQLSESLVWFVRSQGSQ